MKLFFQLLFIMTLVCANIMSSMKNTSSKLSSAAMTFITEKKDRVTSPLQNMRQSYIGTIYNNTPHSLLIMDFKDMRDVSSNSDKILPSGCKTVWNCLIFLQYIDQFRFQLYDETESKHCILRGKPISYDVKSHSFYKDSMTITIEQGPIFLVDNISLSRNSTIDIIFEKQPGNKAAIISMCSDYKKS